MGVFRPMLGHDPSPQEQATVAAINWLMVGCRTEADFEALPQSTRDEVWRLVNELPVRA